MSDDKNRAFFQLRDQLFGKSENKWKKMLLMKIIIILTKL